MHTQCWTIKIPDIGPFEYYCVSVYRFFIITIVFLFNL